MNTQQRTNFNDLAEATQTEQQLIDSHALACTLNTNPMDHMHGRIEDFDEAQAEAEFRISHGFSSYSISAEWLTSHLTELAEASI